MGDFDPRNPELRFSTGEGDPSAPKEPEQKMTLLPGAKKYYEQLYPPVPTDWKGERIPQGMIDA